MIKAIIIDDEEISLTALYEKIRGACKDIKVLKIFTRPEDALKEMFELKPDVVFLDIEMPRMNGFTFLENCKPLDFEVIFTTAYGEYAINALRISALDFLLKPIDQSELLLAVTRLTDRLAQKKTKGLQLEDQLKLFMQYQQQPKLPGNIAVPVQNGLEFVDTSTIIRVKGENVYSVFYLTDGKKMTVSRTLKEVDHLLSQWDFLRVHKSYIINMKCVRKYIKGEGGIVVLSDGSEVEISRREKNNFLQRINEIK